MARNALDYLRYGDWLPLILINSLGIARAQLSWAFYARNFRRSLARKDGSSANGGGHITHKDRVHARSPTTPDRWECLSQAGITACSQVKYPIFAW